ncbi:hypothetical protein [Chitinophaga tropicalis]|uniref:Uncharacterized protein n=1 Tax=Chitinophaga tropicalis TaxID=2683588 RepID=A0A7K1U6A2_9BACT|nr:hypothetical protein [Chitinophaga tropicalis]MVT09869.1 hypothetical protein [Chitinophaga tropicalis]
MKKIILLLLLVLATGASYAQDGNFRRATVRDSIWLSGKWFKEISDDSTLGTGASNILPTQKALKGALYDVVANKVRNIYVSNGSLNSNRRLTGNKQYELFMDSLTAFGVMTRSFTEDSLATFNLSTFTASMASYVTSANKMAVVEVNALPRPYIALHSGYLTAAGFYLDSTNNIGLGKNNPTEKLDVVGNVTATGTVNSQAFKNGNIGSLTFAGNGSPVILRSNNEDLQLLSGKHLSISAEKNMILSTGDSGAVIFNNPATFTAAVSAPFLTVNADIALTKAHHTLRVRTAGITITLPPPGPVYGRIYCIMNASDGYIYFNSGYVDNNIVLNDVASSGVVWLQSDGFNWYRIN